MRKYVNIVIDKRSGRVKIDYEGFVGRECFEAAEKLARMLREKYGVELEQEYVEEKPEAYIEQEEQEQVRAW